MPNIEGPIRLMPDIGDVLNDKSLSDISHKNLFKIAGGYIRGYIPENEEDEDEDEDEDEEGIIRRRVLYRIDASCIEPFKSLTPPPTHLLLRFAVETDVRVHVESLEHWLASPYLASLLVVFRPAIEKRQLLLAFMCTLLCNLPPQCHLLLWVIRGVRNEREMAAILDALLESQCQVDLLCIDGRTTSKQYAVCLSPQYASKIVGRCRSVTLPNFSVKSGKAAFSFMSNLMSSPDCKLLELCVREAPSNIHIYDSDDDDEYMIGISRALTELEGFKKLKRLDICNLPSGSSEGMSSLVASLASPSCCIHDLSINLSSWDDENEADRKGRFSVLVQAFQTGSSLSKLTALRFKSINTNEAASCVVEILGCPQSNCKVRLLDITIEEYDADEPFFKKLQQGIRPRIEGLRVLFHCKATDNQGLSEMYSLSDFLGWEHCSLLWLQCLFRGRSSGVDASLQTKVANSLEPNHLLVHLQISELESPAACSRAAAFLARNRLYKSMGLSKQDCMKPEVGRLFLCGHGEVGKTTLRKSLLKLHSHLSSEAYDCSFNKLFRSCRRSREGMEPRTRGLEIHQLSFQPAQKLAIFDLGGQPDYHIFHHYFMTNTSHDFFIIVCKFTTSTKASQLDVELEYWLRFIVSHRNSVHGPNPKIILVVNFFNAKVSDMQGRAEDLTEELRQKYGQHLTFGGVFGIVALNKKEAVPILRSLESLLQDSLNQKPMIPRLCHDVLTDILPHLANHKKQLTCGIHLCRKALAGNLFVEYLQVKARYILQQKIEGQASNMLEKRIQAALMELHNAGEVIFFPPIGVSKSKRALKRAGGHDPIVSKEHEVVEEHAVDVAADNPSSSRNAKDLSPIITDPNWFCNKVIGNLLAPEMLSGKSEWKFKDVKQVLMDNGCPKQYVVEVLGYLHRLELCYPFCDHASKQIRYFFPAVASDRTLQWPSMFTSQIATTTEIDGNSMHFYGRRIKCMDAERHLIPSGVFARLQVRLNKFCGVGNNRSYKLGYHWVSFVTQNIGVMVRFGKVQDANQESNNTGGQMHTRPHSICMEEDDHPEWIDILLSCPSSQNAQQQATSVEYTIMNGIKSLIYDICQSTSRGIPTVALEECVLSHEAQKHVMPLMEVKSCIIKEGLASHVSWEEQVSIPVVNLLFPDELQDDVMRHVEAIQEIREEFTTAVDGEEEEGREKEEEDSDDGDRLLYPQLHGDLKVLYDLLFSKLNKGLERLGAKLENITVLVKEIKQDVGKIILGLQQAETKILANCSTRLLTQVLLQGVLPAYPYLTNPADGKMEKLKTCLLRRTATVHFLCESLEEGPHEVKEQAGKEVVVEKGILMKMAPFLVPTLTVLCCAARFAANVYLPGVAPLIFAPLLGCLKSIGITDQDLQSKIIPKALNALFDELDVEIQNLYDPKSPMQLNVDEQQRKEGVEALQEFLGSIQNIDMVKDFGLSLVQVGHETDEFVQAQWLCKEHARRYTKKLRHPQNPFSHIAK